MGIKMKSPEEVLQEHIKRGEAALHFFESTDFEKLSVQKQAVIEMIEGCENGEQWENVDRLTGILHLLDAMQDCAVDHLGFQIQTVFPGMEDETA